MLTVTLLLEDLPCPNLVKNNLEIYVDNEKGQMLPVLKTLEDRKWKWNQHKKPTNYIPCWKEGWIQLWQDTGIITQRAGKDPWSLISGENSWVLIEIDWQKSKIEFPSQLKNNNSFCPLCGSIGDDLVFKFYCFNNNCKNFQE
jgi:hypothetical protein